VINHRPAMYLLRSFFLVGDFFQLLSRVMRFIKKSVIDTIHSMELTGTKHDRSSIPAMVRRMGFFWSSYCRAFRGVSGFSFC